MPPSPAVVKMDSMASEPEQRDHVQSLERGLDVILAFSHNRPRLSLAEVAEFTGLSRPTARRMLLTLQHLGYVRSDGRLFALTPRVLALGYAYLSSLNLTEIAQPKMEKVVAIANEACSLSTLDNTEIVYVSRVPTHRVTSLTLATGTRLPAHATAMGLVLLADLSDAELARYLRAADLRPLTSRTISSPRELHRRLSEVRTNDWAMIDQELEEGLRSIAAPVRGSDGRVIAALGMSASVASASSTVMRTEHTPLLVDAAREISHELGAAFGADGDVPRQPTHRG
jgi:IclR family pca regulon transcriptional regulator